MTLEIRSARILLTIVFCCSFLTVNKPNNALGACSWNLLVLNVPMFSSQQFGSGNRNFDQLLLLKHGMVPEFSQTPQKWQPSVQLKLRFGSRPLFWSLEFDSGTGPHCFRFRFHF